MWHFHAALGRQGERRERERKRRSEEETRIKEGRGKKKVTQRTPGNVHACPAWGPNSPTLSTTGLLMRPPGTSVRRTVCGVRAEASHWISLCLHFLVFISRAIIIITYTSYHGYEIHWSGVCYTFSTGTGLHLNAQELPTLTNAVCQMWDKAWCPWNPPLLLGCSSLGKAGVSSAGAWHPWTNGTQAQAAFPHLCANPPAIVLYSKVEGLGWKGQRPETVNPAPFPQEILLCTWTSWWQGG